MAKIIVCYNLPSDESPYYSKLWANVDPEHKVRFSIDDVKNMLGNYAVTKKDSLVDIIYHNFMNEAMLAGYDIIIDNTNLDNKFINELNKLVTEFNEWIALSPLAKSHKYEIKYKNFLDTPIKNLH